MNALAKQKVLFCWPAVAYKKTIIRPSFTHDVYIIAAVVAGDPREKLGPWWT